MAYFVIVWVLLLVICFFLGTAILQALSIWDEFSEGDRFILAEWIGLLSLAILSLSLAFLIPLSFPVSVGVFLSLLVLSLSRPNVRVAGWQIWTTCSVQTKLLGFVSLWAIALYMTQPVTWIDAGLYHVGTVKWLVNYGVVPGVALIHDRLGFASSWFALTALFNPDFIGTRAIALPNGFIAVLGILHFFISIRSIFFAQLNGYPAKLADWFIAVTYSLLIPLFLGSTLFTELLVSSSPDIPIIFVSLITTWLILIIQDRQSEKDAASRQINQNIVSILLFFAVSAIAVKLTGIPLLIVVLFFYALQVNFRLLALLRGAILSGLMLLPVALFGHVTSGCLFYPSTILCSNVPWSLSKQWQGYTFAPTVGPGTWFPDPPPDTPFLPWAITFWLQIELMNQVMAVLLILSIGFVVYVLWRWGFSTLSPIAIIPALGLLGSLFIVVLSPGIRFGLGYLILIPAWGLAQILATLTQSNDYLARFFTGLSHLLKDHSRWLSSACLVMLTLGITINSARPAMQERLGLPPSLPIASIVAAQVNDVHYFHVAKPEENVLCWAAELPCSMGPLRVNIHLRQPDVGVAGGYEYAAP